MYLKRWNCCGTLELLWLDAIPVTTSNSFKSNLGCLVTFTAKLRQQGCVILLIKMLVHNMKLLVQNGQFIIIQCIMSSNR